MADPFTTMMDQLANMGFFTFLLPWLFTFAIVYGLLAKANLFGDKVNNRISAIIGIVAAFFITPFAGPWLATYFASIFGGASVILAGILTVVLFAAMIGIEAKAIGAKRGVMVVVIIGIVLFFFALGGDLGAFGGTTIGSNTVVTIIFIVILLAAIWLVVKGGEGEDKTKTKTPTTSGKEPV